MRPLYRIAFDKRVGRVIATGEDGMKFVAKVNGDLLRVQIGCGHGWDHVSASFADRCPTWEEMEWVKRLCFEDDETAFQLHVPPDDHISFHPYTLHIWKPHSVDIPRPPWWMIGPKAAKEEA